MRKYDVPNPYEQLKEFTRGKATVSRSEYLAFIEGLEGIPAKEKQMMKDLTP